MENTRVCPDCQVEKPTSAFYKNRSSGTGLSTYCRECWGVRNNGYRRVAQEKPKQEIAEKRCGGCGAVKAIEEFGRHKQTKDGYHAKCRACWNAYYHEQRSTPEGAAKASLAVRGSTLKRKYGLTLEDFDKMLKAQGGTCAICDGPQTRRNGKTQRNGTEFAYMCVDHDHATDKVRGLLCDGCNRLLHKLDTHPGWIEKAAAYLT